MSFAIKQLIQTYEEQVATMGSTPQLEIQLERLRAQLQTDEVNRIKIIEQKAAEAAAAEKKAAKKFGKPTPAPTEEPGKMLRCRDCEYDFFLKESQSAFFLEKGMSEPTRCFGCRQERKAARFMIPCLECETEFEFTPADQNFYTAQGWSQPKRCVTCRANKLRSQTLACGGCKKDFNFSIASQKHFKSVGWKPPARCFECRRKLKDVVPVAEARAFASDMLAHDLSKGGILSNAQNVSIVHITSRSAADDAEALRVVEEAFAAPTVEFGFALPAGPAPAIFRGSS
jgi:hypothetical protein